MTNETISVKIAKKIEKFSIAFSNFQSWGSGGQLRPASTESMFFSTYNLVSYTCNLFSSQQTVIFQDVSDGSFDIRTNSSASARMPFQATN